MKHLTVIALASMVLGGCALTEFLEPTINVTELGDGKKRIEYVCISGGTCQHNWRIMWNAMWASCPDGHKKLKEWVIREGKYVHSFVEVECKP